MSNATATAILKCDILNRFTNEIIFTDETVHARCSVNFERYDWNIQDFDEDIFCNIKKPNQNKFEKKYNPDNKYLYALCLNEFYARSEVEDHETKNEKCNDFILLVKDEDIEDVEIEPYDDSDEQYERYRDSQSA